MNATQARATVADLGLTEHVVGLAAGAPPLPATAAELWHAAAASSTESTPNQH